MAMLLVGNQRYNRLLPYHLLKSNTLLWLNRLVKEAIWLKSNIEEMFSKESDVQIHYDSQSVLSLLKNPTFHDWTKHIDVRFHFMRQVIQEEVKLNW